MVAVKMALRRRTSIPALFSGNLELPTKTQITTFPTIDGDRCFPSELVDWEFIHLKPSSYTSLRDILPPFSGGLPSPTVDRSSCGSCREISIKNRLVKQAAWAYLQPMEASPSSGCRSFWQRLWGGFSGDCVRNRLSSFFGFIGKHICSKVSRLFDRVLGALRIG